MPLPNGVDPWGNIHAISPSAMYLGNRGILHRDGVIVRQWANKSWVTCALRYGNRNRKPLMQPNRYSELFFLDEATALAAGHRPCGECRKEDYKRFKAAWFAAHSAADMVNSIAAIDNALHADRVSLGRDKKTFRAVLQDLPHGVIVEIDGRAYLYWETGLRLWTPLGYTETLTSIAPSDMVSVLTPQSVVGAIRAGYRPQSHHTALSSDSTTLVRT